MTLALWLRHYFVFRFLEAFRREGGGEFFEARIAA
jgi:hypothetical protein